ncbi:uncharacterized protein N7459_007204 [Penicillium hispanicum]|uniref:uncharacterized protein n=1 Tax=Penicillium hispanicum TaxID=1080232 RepID=UPI00253F7C7A|nr:uncharacterized protein N7459_007204 [Penicillium hispanicum]KAJ5578240.1 hypothetical protein N7459_007204 [Penicillium hispanicum]
MRVFVTGATGFIGQAVVEELLDAGHAVIGLARSDKSAASLQAQGVEVIRGSIEDHDSLKRGAAKSDGVAHLAFNHDFTKFAENAKVEHAAIQVLGDALAGSNRPLVIAAGTMSLPKGELATEDTGPDLESPANVRLPSEQEISKLATQGVRASAVRLSPTVHGDGDFGFIYQIAQAARAKGQAVYIGDGLGRWPAVHRRDAARLFRLALEKGVAGSKYHAVAEEGVSQKEIAEAFGQAMGIPAVSKTFPEAAELIGQFLAFVTSSDNPTSSKKTQQELGWTPSQPTLLADIKAGIYSKDRGSKESTVMQ